MAIYTTTLFKPYFLGNYVMKFESPAVALAFQWLIAQKKTKGISGRCEKHTLERWANYYISKDDVLKALELAGLRADCYPRTNISKRVIEPLPSHIPEFRTMDYL
jgi:hypothetical protein